VIGIDHAPRPMINPNHVHNLVCIRHTNPVPVVARR